MGKLKVTVKFENGKLIDSHKRLLQQSFAPLDGVYTLTVEEFKNTRSARQNRYYWSVVVKAIREIHYSYGTVYSDIQAHKYIKKYILHLDEILEDFDGTYITIEGSTRKDTKKFEEYMEVIRAWAASGHQYIIPLPNEFL